MVLLALAAGFAAATVPGGPRLAFVAVSAKPAGIGIDSVGPSGADFQRVLKRTSAVSPLPFALSALTWSPDGSLLAFSGLGRKSGIGIAVVGADGSGARIIPGTENALDPVFAPDGRTMAFVRVRGSGKSAAVSAVPRLKFARTRAAIFTVSIDGKDLRQLTSWRSGVFDLPSSYSPDGSLLGITHTDRKNGSSAAALRTDGTGSTLLARDAGDPVYSPDGSRIALLRNTHTPATKGRSKTGATELYVANADGSNPVRLTNSPNKVKLWPSWDPSGERLAYTQLRTQSFASLLTGLGDSIREINIDGTCPTLVLAARGMGFYGAAWQPGPGRAVGPISC